MCWAHLDCGRNCGVSWNMLFIITWEVNLRGQRVVRKQSVCKPEKTPTSKIQGGLETCQNHVKPLNTSTWYRIHVHESYLSVRRLARPIYVVDAGRLLSCGLISTFWG